VERGMNIKDILSEGEQVLFSGHEKRLLEVKR